MVSIEGEEQTLEEETASETGEGEAGESAPEDCG